MNLLSIAAQAIIALSIVIVWVFRFDNIVQEFNSFKLPDLLRNGVGAAKIALSTLLIVSIWYPNLVVATSLAMGFLMLCAQVVHFQAKSPFIKRIPSAVLFGLCIFVAWVNSGTAA